MELVRRDVRGSTPGWASSRGRFFGPCFTSRPPSRDVIQPERYTARSTSRRLRFKLGTIYTSLRVREKQGLCASIPASTRAFYSLVASPLSLQLDVTRGVFCPTNRPSTICRAQFIGQRFSSDGTV